MIVSIHQPQYLPWLGYFDKIDRADVFCYLDNVQFKKNEWQNRNRIKTVKGWQWITVPVAYRFGQKISEVGIAANVNWGKKHIQSLVTNYAKAPFFDEHIGFFKQALSQKWSGLSELNIAMIEYIGKALGIENTKTVLASGLGPCDDQTGRLIDICRAVNADTYLSGREGANYMKMDMFREAGIRVVFQDFHHPEYPQLFGDFVSHLSAIDLLFNCGGEGLRIFRASNPH